MLKNLSILHSHAFARLTYSSSPCFVPCFQSLLYAALAYPRRTLSRRLRLLLATCAICRLLPAQKEQFCTAVGEEQTSIVRLKAPTSNRLTGVQDIKLDGASASRQSRGQPWCGSYALRELCFLLKAQSIDQLANSFDCPVGRMSLRFDASCGPLLIVVAYGGQEGAGVDES